MKYEIIIEAEFSHSPRSHEFAAAIVISEYFRSDVIFIRPGNFRTPDFDVSGTKWELKSLMGSSARTVENNVRAARKQSKNLIIDLSRIKIHQQRAVARINFFLSKPNQFDRVLVITKTKKNLNLEIKTPVIFKM